MGARGLAQAAAALTLLAAGCQPDTEPAPDEQAAARPTSPATPRFVAPLQQDARAPPGADPADARANVGSDAQPDSGEAADAGSGAGDSIAGDAFSPPPPAPARPAAATMTADPAALAAAAAALP